jgi:hypothetical protein
MLGQLVIAVIARHDWNISSNHDLFGFALAAHGDDGGGGRTNELDAIVHTLLRKSCIFREEAEAGVEGLAVGILCDLEDLATV